jgi:hypothetical protein
LFIEIDASRNVGTSEVIILYQLFSKDSINQNNPLCYYRENKSHVPIYYVYKIKNIDKYGLHPISGESSLSDLKKRIIHQYNTSKEEKERVKPSNNPYSIHIFFMGTQIFELRKKYYEKR